MNAYQLITPAFAGYTTAMDRHVHMCDPTLPLDKQTWYSASAEPQMIYVGFDGYYNVHQIDLHEFGSDQTTHRMEIGFGTLSEYGHPTTEMFFSGSGYNITRGGPHGMGFSLDNEGDTSYRPIRDGFLAKRLVAPPLKLQLEKPLVVAGVYLRIAGHGWFSGSGLRFGGTLAGRFRPGRLKQMQTAVDRECGAMWYF